MGESSINCLSDLARLRDAPDLSQDISARLHSELRDAMSRANWFTVGVMAPSAEAALVAYRALEQRQGWEALEVVDTTTEPGPVFLKANQKGGSIRIRIEHGLGQGLLITGHDDADGQRSTTWGPLPLNFFSLPNA